MIRNSFSVLCSSLHIGLHNVGHSGDEFSICRLSPAGGDGISEVFFQDVQISSGPGHFDEMADGTPKIPFIGILVA